MRSVVEEIFQQVDMFTPILVVGFGIITGLSHAFEPDHVAALSTQITKSKIKKKSIGSMLKQSVTTSSLLGALWGAGHTTTLVLAGVLVYLFAVTIQDILFTKLEFMVGIMLVFLGIAAILNRKITFRHRHPHKHKDGSIHLDEHKHEDLNHNHGHRAYVIGLIHGMAGSGSLIVLTSTMFNSVEITLGFIVIFGLGSVIGMIIVGSLLGIPLMIGNKIRGFKRIFDLVSGSFSLIIGLNIVYQIGIADMFTII